MDPRATSKAKQRLRVAADSASSLDQKLDFDEFSDKWYVFLHAAKGIYTTLEQGAKTSPQARQWFGGKNRERRNDELLRYVYEARNDDEHGIESVAELKPSTLDLGKSGPNKSSVMRDQYGNTFVNVGTAYRIHGADPTTKNLPRLTALDGKPVGSEYTPAKIVLKPVRDRAGNLYHPPTFHLGTKIASEDPKELAELVLKYLADLIREAEGFHRPSP